MNTLLFSQKCNIIQRVRTLDSVNRPVYTDTILQANVKCKLDSIRLRSSERDDQGAMKSIFRSIIYMENVIGITADMRITLDNHTFEIVSINPVSNLVTTNHLEIEVVESETP
jgi:head-tail adaptor